MGVRAYRRYKHTLCEREKERERGLKKDREKYLNTPEEVSWKT